MPTTIDPAFDLKQATRDLAAAIKDDRLDDAEALYEMLSQVLNEDDLLTFRVFITIQRGRVLDALQFINSLPPDRCPELKVICLHLLKDPTWHSEAESLEGSTDPTVRKAMRELLQRPKDWH